MVKMGCASSAHMIPVSNDKLMKSSEGPTTNSTSGVKDFPKVVEKVLETTKENGFQTDYDYTDRFHKPVETFTSKVTHDTDSESSAQGIIHGFLIENVSPTSQLSAEGDEEKSHTTSIEIDSLRTSSPDSEIEKLFANDNHQSTITLKSHFSEQEHSILDLRQPNIHYGSHGNNFIRPITPNTDLIIKPIQSKQKVLVIGHTTDWEKQADILANTQKYNPIDAMRKFRKETRSSSSLPHRSHLKLINEQFYEEDIEEIHQIQSPHRSTLSSANSERHFKTNKSELHTGNCRATIGNETNSKKIKKPSIENKRIDNLSVSKNGQVLSPSNTPYKVRERCAVCYNKYKH